MMRSLTRTLVHCACLAVVLLATTSTAGAQVFVEYAASMGGDFRGIITGPGGNVWVAASLPAKVAKVTTGGSFMEFAVPGAGAEAIALGSDGNVWFTEPEKSVIGRVTTLGVVTELVVPTADSVPRGITAGPDGNLWFTENQGNKIVRMKTSGAFTKFPLPTPNSFPSAITAGSDGRLWFTESSTIGAMETNGALTEYAIPSGGFAQAIAAGFDGNLWFTEIQVGRIGRTDFMTGWDDGTFSHGRPTSVAFASDGRLFVGNGVTGDIVWIAPLDLPWE